MSHTTGTNRFSVGLTGGIGSGKSTVADLFAQRGAALVDTDLIAHQLTAPNGSAIARIKQTFGDRFIQADGAMDRGLMRQEVFSNPDAKTKLEAILHPLIRSETERAANEVTGDYLMYVVPLLIESSLWINRVSRVLVVDTPEELQIQRVIQRNSFDEQQVRAIIASQATRAARLAAADDVIVNQATTAELLPQVEKLHQLYISLAKAH
jgi:dephospho-CoA kinase